MGALEISTSLQPGAAAKPRPQHRRRCSVSTGCILSHQLLGLETLHRHHCKLRTQLVVRGGSLGETENAQEKGR